jgi:ABC-type dipeptide/oligopeptide/nickel transport system permease component
MSEDFRQGLALGIFLAGFACVFGVWLGLYAARKLDDLCQKST